MEGAGAGGRAGVLSAVTPGATLPSRTAAWTAAEMQCSPPGGAPQVACKQCGCIPRQQSCSSLSTWSAAEGTCSSPPPKQNTKATPTAACPGTSSTPQHTHHLLLTSSSKYRLEKVVGALVQGPRKPLRSVWQRPRVWAPLRATISLGASSSRCSGRRTRMAEGQAGQPPMA